LTDYSHLVGHRFPGGRFTLSPHLAWLWADCAMVEPDAEVAHPTLSYYSAMQGCGVTIQEIFDLMGADANSGAMFGECVLEYHGALTPGETYEVEGGIVAVERKQGRRAGAFDSMTFQISGRREDEAEALFTVTNSFIFPRREEAVT
jgi:hypothetical protein